MTKNEMKEILANAFGTIFMRVLAENDILKAQTMLQYSKTGGLQENRDAVNDLDEIERQNKRIVSAMNFVQDLLDADWHDTRILSQINEFSYEEKNETE